MANLELENLTKRYSDVVSVDGMTMSVAHGEFVCLLGPSGCGKTTTLRMIAGFLQPDAGEIRVGGKAVSSVRSVVPPEQRNMSMIFQSYAVWPHMTVRQNVGYGLKMKSMPRPERQARTDVLLGAARQADELLRQDRRRGAVGGRWYRHRQHTAGDRSGAGISRQSSRLHRRCRAGCVDRRARRTLGPGRTEGESAVQSRAMSRP